MLLVLNGLFQGCSSLWFARDALVWFLPIVCTAWCSLASSSAYVGTPSLCHKGTRQSEVSWKTVQLCAFLNSLKDWHISGCFSTLIFLDAESSIHSQRGCEGINSLTLGCIRSRVQTVEVEKGSNETRSPQRFSIVKVLHVQCWEACNGLLTKLASSVLGPSETPCSVHDIKPLSIHDF